MGQDPSDEELFDMIAAVDDDGSAEIDFGEFCKVIANQKAAAAQQNDETDTGKPATGYQNTRNPKTSPALYSRAHAHASVHAARALVMCDSQSMRS